MEMMLGFANLAGFFISWFVYYHRAGLARVKADQGIDWRQFLIPNLPFFLLCWGKMFVWPLVLVFWMVTGCKPSPWRATTEIDGIEVRKVLRVNSGATAGEAEAAAMSTTVPPEATSIPAAHEIATHLSPGSPFTRPPLPEQRLPQNPYGSPVAPTVAGPPEAARPPGASGTELPDPPVEGQFSIDFQSPPGAPGGPAVARPIAVPPRPASFQVQDASGTDGRGQPDSPVELPPLAYPPVPPTWTPEGLQEPSPPQRSGWRNHLREAAMLAVALLAVLAVGIVYLTVSTKDKGEATSVDTPRVDDETGPTTDSTGPATSSSTPTSAQPSSTVGLSQDTCAQGGDNKARYELTEVRSGVHPEYDRLVFEFTATGGVPTYKVTRTGQNLKVQFATSLTSWQSATRDLSTGTTAIRAVSNATSRDGVTTWDVELGATSPACPSVFVLQQPARLVIDVAK